MKGSYAFSWKEGSSMYKRILIPLDGSDLAEQAVPTALTLARQFESELFLLRVVMPLPKSYRAGVASVAAIEAAEREAVQEAADYLDGLAAGLRDQGFPVQFAARFGNPAKVIVDFLQPNEVDLLVMCTRGQTGPARWLLGSVVDHVVRGSSIPIVVVPARMEGAQAVAG
jgi:nucleotide-binding universal stress UspA family protein